MLGSRPMSADALRYQTGFGERLRDRGACRRAADRAEQSAEAAVRPVYRGDQRHAVHRAARAEPADVDVPDPAVRRARAVSRRSTPALLRSAPFNEAAADAEPAALAAAADSESADRFRCRASSRSAATAIPRCRLGAAMHMYAANASMTDRFFYDADGELLIAPQLGALLVRTELGILRVAPGEICVVPRGVKFRVELEDGEARGYVCENYGPHFRLPELGPIGTNGLANSRDFLVAGRGVRGTRRRLPSRREIPGRPLGGRDRSLAARHRRVARHVRAVQVRPRALQRDEHGQLRPPGPVDLLRARGAVGDSGHREHRVRADRRPLDRRAQHVPAAAVPSQRRERVRRPREGPLYRQGRRVRARLREPAQLHGRPRTGLRVVRARLRGRAKIRSTSRTR